MNAKRLNKQGGATSTQTPRRFNSARGGLPIKEYDDSSRSPYPDSRDYPPDSSPMSGLSTLPRRTNKLSPPSLSLSYDISQDNKYNSSTDDSNNIEYGNRFSKKGGSKSRFSVKSGDSGFEEMGKGDLEMNLKNTKNKLNLQFAPDKINRPQETEEKNSSRLQCPLERKISPEINGNLTNSEQGIKSSLTNSQLLEEIRKMDEEEDSSRSESEISVLELSSFIDLKQNEKDANTELSDHFEQDRNNDSEFNSGE